ncbi:nitroreductase family protein [archaeon]|jgi:nitroreductase|nr:nitroreductase family protein [archaeon]MBT6040795.1 nitroreductase family protein [Candidatus Woesearchaeota archaeon]MBT4022406.1 nitroreductase family protein [archaeon]MBT4273284.1 nitroreductase family protein [archaeon]MBT4461273.1 nitroreductase family protein [archaeon]
MDQDKKPKDKSLSDQIKMTVFEAIATRRSVRKFTSQDIPMELLGVIIDAGRYAPSSGNLQNWRMIIVKNPDARKKIAEVCQQQLWMAEAPVFLVVCSDTEKIKRFYGKRGEMFFSVQNVSASIQNMLLTTHSLGMASCWVGAFDEDVLKRILGMPGHVRPQAVLPIGYPDEIVPAPSHFTMENVTFFEQYGNKISNVARVMQNPLIFDKVGGLIGGVVNAAKDIIQKRKKE